VIETAALCIKPAAMLSKSGVSICSILAVWLGALGCSSEQPESPATSASASSAIGAGTLSASSAVSGAPDPASPSNGVPGGTSAPGNGAATGSDAPPLSATISPTPQTSSSAPAASNTEPASSATPGATTIDPVTPEPNSGNPTAPQLFERLHLGWNLGNSLDVPEGETAWGNPAVTPALMQAVADAGFDVVRIPVTWAMHMGPAPDYVIEPAWLARVAEVVNYANDAGMHAIINVHHDGADAFEGVEWLSLTNASGAVDAAHSAAVEAQFRVVWQQLAIYFRDFDSSLSFESMNEIHEGYDAPLPAYYDIITQLNQAFIDIVRGSGGNNADRVLVIPGYNTNIDYTVAGFELPTDPAPSRLALSIHFYDPWSFAGEGATPVWGTGTPGVDEWGQEEHVVAQFDKLKTQFVDQGVPVLLGEFGAIRNDGYDEYRRYYVEYVAQAASQRGSLPVFWDNGGLGSGADKFGLFDRATNEVAYPDVLDALLRAVSTDAPLSSIATP
jgi:endoglucanase